MKVAPEMLSDVVKAVAAVTAADRFTEGQLEQAWRIGQGSCNWHENAVRASMREACWSLFRGRVAVAVGNSPRWPVSGTAIVFEGKQPCRRSPTLPT